MGIRKRRVQYSNLTYCLTTHALYFEKTNQARIELQFSQMMKMKILLDFSIMTTVSNLQKTQRNVTAFLKKDKNQIAWNNRCLSPFTTVHSFQYV